MTSQVGVPRRVQTLRSRPQRETRPVTADAARERPPYQVMPDLSAEAYEALKDDIRERGVLVPVEFTEDGEVLDGHHRLRACRDLGITSYPRVVRSGLNEDERRAHALALNVHRRHLTPEQRAEAVMRLREQGWSVRRIADATGVPKSTVDRDIRTNGGGSLPTVVGIDGRTFKARKPRKPRKPRKQATRPTSVYVHSDAQQRAAEDALRTLDGAAPAKTVDLRRLGRLEREHRSRERRATLADVDGDVEAGVPEIRHSTIQDLDIPEASVDLILTDPPYSGRECWDTDGPWDTLGRQAVAWLKPGGLLLAYSGHSHLARSIATLSPCSDDGLAYWWTFAIVHPGGPGSGQQVRTRGLVTSWRPVLAFRKTGARSLPPFSSDPIAGGGREKDGDHPWQQGVDETRTLIRQLTLPRALVVDPFVGSGTVAVAAALEGRACVAADRDADYVALARHRVGQALTADE